jgi:hypothetical protein
VKTAIISFMEAAIMEAIMKRMKFLAAMLGMGLIFGMMGCEHSTSGGGRNGDSIVYTGKTAQNEPLRHR